MTVPKRLQRLAFGIRRNFRDSEARSARGRATALKHRPWEHGRIGSIERHVSRIMTGWPVGKDYTTGELARAIYANPTWDQNCRPREDGEPVPPIKSWMLSRVRKAAAAFADPCGQGWPWPRDLVARSTGSILVECPPREDRARQGPPVFWRYAGP